MQLKMSNYSQSKIYRIIPAEGGEDGDVYFGSTTQSLNERLRQHRKGFRHDQFKSTSQLLFQKYGEERIKIELIETYPVDSKKDLLIRERFYIENNDCVNRYIPGRDQAESQREYNKKNAEKIKAYHAVYYAANKDEINRKTRERYAAKKAAQMDLEKT